MQLIKINKVKQGIRAHHMSDQMVKAEIDGFFLKPDKSCVKDLLTMKGIIEFHC